ncbi:alpha/beta fold hydrolase [Geodermatophilus sp. SYSU D00703]
MSLPPDAPSPITVVLVHGAFADSSGWNGVIAALQGRGLPVVAPPNPLRGLTADSAYIAGVLGQIDGPVLLVGHSYGGAVITNAATGAPNVLGLVYVAGFAPDEGEVLGTVESGSRDSVLTSALVPRRYPTGPGGQTATEFGIHPARFHDAFAADLPADVAAVMAATQRPIAEAAFTDPSGPPAWRRLPSWAVVATGDLTIGTDLVRSMAQRAGARIVELEGSHVIMVSRPDAVTEVIGTALEAVAAAAADIPTPRQRQEEAGQAAGRTP